MSRSTDGSARVARRRTRAAITTAAALAAAAAFAVPAQAAVTTPGASIEAFHGRDFIGLAGYSPRQPLNVEVFRGTTLLNSVAGRRADSQGALEINHVGGADCFDDGTAPDIVPGDEVRVSWNDGATVHTDSMIVHLVTLQRTDTGPDTDNPGTPAAPLPNSVVLNGTGVAGDLLALRIRGNTRIDREVTVAADGTWSSQFDVDPADFDEASAEWANGDLTELTIDDGGPGACATTPDTFVAPVPGPPAPLPAPLPGPTPPAPVVIPGPTRVVTNTVIQVVPGAAALGAANQGVLGSQASSALRVSNLSLSRRISLTRLRLQGLRMSMRVPQGTNRLRIAVYKARNGQKTGRALLQTTRTPRAGLYRVTLRNRSLLRKLRAGSYVVEVRAGRSADSLGTVRRIAFRVTR